jgi:hypothetical protein
VHIPATATVIEWRCMSYTAGNVINLNIACKGLSLMGHVSESLNLCEICTPWHARAYRLPCFNNNATNVINLSSFEDATLSRVIIRGIPVDGNHRHYILKCIKQPLMS